MKLPVILHPALGKTLTPSLRLSQLVSLLPALLLAFVMLPGAVQALSDAPKDGAESMANDSPRPATVVPHGYVDRLEFERNGRTYGFGPFVGYYFKPVSPPNVQELRFLCYNEGSHYTRDLPPGTLLFKGTAVLNELPDLSEQGVSLPKASGQRITPLIFDEAPESWVGTRPSKDFRHFHSCHDAQGPVRLGFWLKHVGAATFTYDMGGRVGEQSPLHHRVQAGEVDDAVAPLLEFDAGPKGHRLSPRPW